MSERDLFKKTCDFLEKVDNAEQMSEFTFYFVHCILFSVCIVTHRIAFYWQRPVPRLYILWDPCGIHFGSCEVIWWFLWGLAGLCEMLKATCFMRSGKCPVLVQKEKKKNEGISFSLIQNVILPNSDLNTAEHNLLINTDHYKRFH